VTPFLPVQVVKLAPNFVSKEDVVDAAFHTELVIVDGLNLVEPAVVEGAQALPAFGGVGGVVSATEGLLVFGEALDDRNHRAGIGVDQGFQGRGSGRLLRGAICLGEGALLGEQTKKEKAGQHGSYERRPFLRGRVAGLTGDEGHRGEGRSSIHEDQKRGNP
jgi:hypothetical protein